MSRTIKDKPPKLLYGDEVTKKKKTKDTKWHWLQATPSWWTNLFMNRPLRRKARAWEHKVAQIANVDELEDIDPPNQSKKPHKYYW